MAEMRLGVVSDIHFGDPRSSSAWHNPYDFVGLGERLERAVELFDEYLVDAIVVLGDISDQGDPASTRAALAALAQAKAPLLLVAGNHDCLQDDARVASSAAGLGEMLDDRLRWIGDIPIAGIAIETDVASQGMRLANARRAPHAGSASVFASHFPLISRADALAAHGLRYAGDLRGHADALEAVVDGHTPTVVLNGHLHARDSACAGQVLQLAAGALIEPPYDVAFVDVQASDGLVSVRRRCEELGATDGLEVPTLVGPHEDWVFDGAGWRCIPSADR